MKKVLLISVLILQLALIKAQNNEHMSQDSSELTPEEEELVCYKGGCSGEVCSSNPEQVSPCIYKPEFECFDQAVCEPQFNGQCGFTTTVELILCLIASQG
jgi:hypothetical protein